MEMIINNVKCKVIIDRVNVVNTTSVTLDFEDYHYPLQPQHVYIKSYIERLVGSNEEIFITIENLKSDFPLHLDHERMNGFKLLNCKGNIILETKLCWQVLILNSQIHTFEIKTINADENDSVDIMLFKDSSINTLRSIHHVVNVLKDGMVNTAMVKENSLLMKCNNIRYFGHPLDLFDNTQSNIINVKEIKPLMNMLIADII